MRIIKQEILIHYPTKKSTLKTIVSGCVVRSEHRIDKLDAKAIEKEHLNVFIIEPFVGMAFLGFRKEVQKEPPEVVYKKVVLKYFAIFAR